MKKKLISALFFAVALTTSVAAPLTAEKVEVQEKRENVFSVKDIKFYKTISDNPAQERKMAKVEHGEAIKLVEEYIKANDLSIVTDLEDPAYQQFVLSLGTAFDEFSEEDMKKIVSFVQFIDYYENHAQNNKLKGFKNKLAKNTVLSEQENGELSSLLPVSPNDPATAETDETSGDIVSIATVYSNGYDNIKARDYAYKWWDGRNPLYDYYAYKAGCSIYDKSCWSQWNDCADFVSQALYNGGMKMRYGSSYTSSASWSYGVVPSYTWGGAHNFYTHWKARAGVASSVSALQTGDAVNADFTGDGSIDHTALITKNTGSYSSNKYLTQHTTDKKETTTLANWYNSGYKVYGYEMDKASN
ncbi:amidase domain-containing protein [Mesobacillus subterraneus]|uniref:amidase domain-containing protein n=1 Tax=Mesobacillus subterraneus TaxID=285983 RepID=UPI00273EE7D1|nr:amidase domain-containing protein [Mesobacillus subterraneus]WLR55927.1 amidase domain-containing protein [Mesobacillus subterraneus]